MKGGISKRYVYTFGKRFRNNILDRSRVFDDILQPDLVENIYGKNLESSS